jgi:DNA polymerase III epsilon subunit-like protein
LNPWIAQPIFFVDFEGSRTSGILEFGVVTLHGAVLGESRTGLCSPSGAVRPEDIAVHGLTGESLAGQAPFTDEWEYFASRRERGPLAAHYAGVENALLKSVWPYPRNSPDFARPGERLIEWGPWIDTARIYAQLYPHFTTGSLEGLVVAAGLQAEVDAFAAVRCPPDRRRYHCALYDALAGAALLAALARDPVIAGLSIMQLLALSTLDPDRSNALRQQELF